MARTAYDEQFGGGLSVAITAAYAIDLPGYPEGKRLLNIAPDAPGYDVLLPDARRLQCGRVIAVRADGEAVELVDHTSGSVRTLASKDVCVCYLLDNSTEAGQWITRVFPGSTLGSYLTIGRVQLDFHVAQDTLNLDVRALADAAGYDGVTPAAVRVLWDGAFVVGSSTATEPAFDTGSWPAGSTMFVDPYRGRGKIVGRGGDAGRGGDVAPGLLAQNGSDGGVAMVVRLNTVLIADEILGGGGGGGGAASATQAGGGGGGGAGYLRSQGGAPGSGGGAWPGDSGAINYGGLPGHGANNGGAGGFHGQSGANGSALGGAAGDAIQRATAATLTKIRAGTITGAETTF